MNKLWHKIISCILLCGSVSAIGYLMKTQPLKAFDFSVRLENMGKVSLKDHSNIKQQLVLISQKPAICQAIDRQYQDFYNFETRNYRIGICLKEDEEEWFYYRESKSNPNSALLLPATVVFGGDVFKAVDGRVTYFVGINSDGYYSSVMYGNNQMIFEPELSEMSASAISSNNESVTSVEVSNPENLELEDKNSELGVGYWKVCTEDPNDLHPNLNGWQQFIGKTPSIISEYAQTKGHSFYYSDADMGGALVETTDGLMVSLNIVPVEETVSGICVKPIASF